MLAYYDPKNKVNLKEEYLPYVGTILRFEKDSKRIKDGWVVYLPDGRSFTTDWTSLGEIVYDL